MKDPKEIAEEIATAWFGAVDVPHRGQAKLVTMLSAAIQSDREAAWLELEKLRKEITRLKGRDYSDYISPLEDTGR